MAPKKPPPPPRDRSHGGKGEKWDPEKYGGKACLHGAPILACAACKAKSK